MKIPTQLRVGGKTYAVLYPYVFSERTDQAAQSCHGTNLVKVSDHTSTGELTARENVEEALIHELLHCVDVVYNNGALDEATVNRLGQGLYQALRDSGMLA